MIDWSPVTGIAIRFCPPAVTVSPSDGDAWHDSNLAADAVTLIDDPSASTLPLGATTGGPATSTVISLVCPMLDAVTAAIPATFDDSSAIALALPMPSPASVTCAGTTVPPLVVKLTTAPAAAAAALIVISADPGLVAGK